MPTDRFLANWIAVVTAFEALGYLAPSLAGILTERSGWTGPEQVGVLTAAGLIEGALLGTGQAIALQRRVRLPVRAWIVGTSLAAGLVWSSVLIAPRLATTPQLPLIARVALTALVGAVALLAMGGVQAWLLRDELPHARRWIGWTALAWILALPLSFLPAPLVDEHTPLAVHLVLWPLAGVLMALVMAVVTGLGMRRLLAGGRRLRSPGRTGQPNAGTGPGPFPRAPGATR